MHPQDVQQPMLRIQHMESMWGRVTNALGGTGQQQQTPAQDGGNAPPNPDPNAQQQQQQQQQDGGNPPPDNQDNLDPFGVTPQNTPQRQQQQGQQQAQQPDGTQQQPVRTVDDYVGEFDFTSVVDQNALSEALGNSDVPAILAEFKKAFGAAHKQGLRDGARLVQSAEERMEDSTRRYVRGNTDAASVMAQLQSEAPLAKNPRFEPMYRGVLLKFLEKGETAVDAVKKTKAYMDDFTNQAGGGATQRPGNNGPGGFGAGPDGNPLFPPQAQQQDNAWLEDLFPAAPANQ